MICEEFNSRSTEVMKPSAKECYSSCEQRQNSWTRKAQTAQCIEAFGKSVHLSGNLRRSVPNFEKMHCYTGGRISPILLEWDMI